ncbi:MAG TPA: RNA methyltransferase [Micromonosporaceae bacterium]|nr:RNA methyltransferase [Micromonosporaceae bacterium]
MAYDENLADRVRELVGRERGVTEKRMFGGLAMLLDGNMAVVIRGKGGLLVRVDVAQYEAALAERGAEEMKMRGRPMRGWITVEASACAKPADLRRWVGRGVSSARSLPPK